jgi:hypothetical protein
VVSGPAAQAPPEPGTAEVEPATAASTEAIDPELAAAAASDSQQSGSSASAARPQEDAAARSTSLPLASLNPDISFIMDTAFGWFSRAEHIRQGGHAVDDNGFVPQALELAASGAVDPYFRFDLYFQLQHLHLEEAFLTTLALPAGLQARAGYFNVAFGRQNPQHLHSWNFINPPLMHTRFMSEEHWSGTGAELSMLLPLPWYAVVLAEVMTPSSAAGFRSATFATVDKNGSGRTDGPEDFLYVGRLENFLELSTNWSLLLGGSAAFGQSPYVPDNRATLFGSDVYLKWRPLTDGGNVAVALTVEAVMRDTQVPRDTLRDFGGYAQLDVQTSRRLMLGLRGDLTDVLSGAVPDSTKFPGQQTRGSLSITFMPTHFSKLRIQSDVSRVEGSGSPVFAVFLQTEVSAGEHGAHKF